MKGIWSLTTGMISAALLSATARAENADAPNMDTFSVSTAARPAILPNRWQEDWSVLSDPAVPREPLDELKYLPLLEDDPQTFLSFGANLRERFEGLDAPGFGVGGAHTEDYVISRLQMNADLRLKSQVQVFVQLQSDFAPWKKVLKPTDRDRLDLEQAFVGITESVYGGSLTFRAGRQEIDFDRQRFISTRDGTNVRQSYDTVWSGYERDHLRLIGFYMQPVQSRDFRAFDDYSSGHVTLGGARLELRLPSNTELSVTVFRFTHDQARFPSVNGNERRDIVDAHVSGTSGAWDWDIEGMNQTGSIGAERIEAWGAGSLAGYTFRDEPLRPRIGLQIDAASGDQNPADHLLGTFNPLYPNGYYINLSGFTGYANLIQVKPSLTLHPTSNLSVQLAEAGLWRETTGDSIYMLPNIPISGTAGHGSPFTATYSEVRADWNVSEHVAAMLEAEHYVVGHAIRAVVGDDANYVGVELRYGW